VALVYWQDLQERKESMRFSAEIVGKDLL